MKTLFRENYQGKSPGKISLNYKSFLVITYIHHA
jgi:hypothetical protein